MVSPPVEFGHYIKMSRLPWGIVWTGVSLLLGSGCTSATGPAAEPAEGGVQEGYPVGVTQLGFGIDLYRTKTCLGTLIDEHWVLTAAHCLSELPLGGTGVVRGVLANFSTRDAWIHPEALLEGSGRFDSEFRHEDVVAAHDLALIRFNRGADEPIPAAFLSSDEDATQSAFDRQELAFGRHRDEREQTGHAKSLGLVSARSLLGAGQMGVLLAAQGDAVVAGDSGAGVFATPLSGTAVELIGVVQNANAESPRAPFGIVPLWLSDHLEWIERTLDENPMETDEPPREDDIFWPGSADASVD